MYALEHFKLFFLKIRFAIPYPFMEMTFLKYFHFKVFFSIFHSAVYSKVYTRKGKYGEGNLFDLHYMNKAIYWTLQ